MKNNIKIIIFITIIFCSFFNTKSPAENSLKFLSLKNNKVNLRQGPSFEYPVILIYKKKYLPIVIIEKSETWRQVRDFENNSGWIHISQLSKRKSGINIKDNAVIYKKPTIYSRPIARLEIGRLLLIEKCKSNWCKVKTSDYTGWMNKNYLWGKT